MTRIGAPGLGATSGPYLRKGEFQISSQLTRFETDNQFGGGVFDGNQQRTDLYATDSEVKEGGVTMDSNIGYGLSRQVSLNVGVPVILYSHWSTKLAGTRYNQTIHGIADVSVGVNYWMMNCERYPDKNISFGMNVRVPTGNSNYQVLYPNSLGQDFRERPSFPGTQPGSGAWALRPVIEAFYSFEHFTVYGTATYQFSLRAHNDTNPLGATLNPAGLTATREEVRVLSTPDSYLFNVGIGGPVPKVSRLSAFLNFRAVGVPVHNVLTATFGYRQPGYYTTIEPGIGWNIGRISYNLSAPLRVHAGTRNNFIDQKISSDFTRYSLVLGMSFKFGGNAPAPSADAP